MDRNAVQAANADSERPARARVRFMRVSTEHDHFTDQRNTGQKPIVGQMRAAIGGQAFLVRQVAFIGRGDAHPVTAE